MSPELSIHWPSLAVGSALGIALGSAVAWQVCLRWQKRSELRSLSRTYASLSGKYAVHRVREDGTQEPSGGTVDLAWQPDQGLLEASGFQANGHPDWHSYIRMSRDYPGAGTGNYNNSDSIHGGLLQVIYSRQTKSFHVTGTASTRIEFAQCWKRNPTA
jgi:hypothetical protein